MRRITMFNRVSLDGSFASADGKLVWMVPDDELDEIGASASGSTDTLLLGRKTYEMFASFWPKALRDPNVPDPHGAQRRSAQQGTFAASLERMTKLVFSRTLSEVSWNNSHLVREFEPQKIAALKEQTGGDILVLGSGSIVSLLTQHALIDDYQFVVGPVVLGSGRPLFHGVTQDRKLKLQESRAFSSGNVLLHYTRG